MKSSHILNLFRSHSPQANKATAKFTSSCRNFHNSSPNSSTRSSTHPFSTSKVFKTRKFSTKNYIEFIPPIDKDAKLVLPISVGRYNTSESSQKEKFNKEINTLLTRTADMLKDREVASVDVICTAGLHADWGKEKISEIEDLFYSQHCQLLEQQSAVYTWESWIQMIGKQRYINTVQMITEKSPRGSAWYDLMVTTHESVKVSHNLEQSLQYQRTEYAAIFLMQKYTNLVYLGQISPAWAFLYKIFPDTKLPFFTRAVLKTQPPQQRTSADVSHTTNIIVEMVERTLTSPNFPAKEKEKIANILTSLFNVYVPPLPIESKQDNKDNVLRPR